MAPAFCGISRPNECGNPGLRDCGPANFRHYYSRTPTFPESQIPLPAAYLFDLDGTLYQGTAAIPGAVDTIRSLRNRGIPLRFVTNTTSKPRRAIVKRLRSYGFEVHPQEVFTALLAGATLARELDVKTILPLVPPEALEDLDGFDLVGGTSSGIVDTRRALRAPTGLSPGRTVDAVMVGDLADLWTFSLMQQAFTALIDGARLIALSRDRYWMTEAGLTLDSGPFVVALEYASEKESIVAGKPNPAFFQAVVLSLGLPAGTPWSEIVMVGDDILGDIAGAQHAGCQGYLVQTGKYREDVVSRSGITPDRVLTSVVDLG